MEPAGLKLPFDVFGSNSSLAIFTHVEVKRREVDEVAFYKRMKFAEIPRDLRLSQLVETALRVLKCSDYNSQRRTSCFLCLPSWKPQRLCDVVLDPHKANTGAVLGPVAHLATLYIAVINEDLPPHNLEAIQSFIKFYIKLCRVDCQSLSSFISQHNFPLAEADILALISDKPQKQLHLTLTDLTRCNEWCTRIMQTHHAVTNYFMRPNAFLGPHPLTFLPGEDLKPEPLSLPDWHPHSPNMGGAMPSMKSFASAMAMHSVSGGAVLNQHTPLLAHPASHSPHDAGDYFSSVLSQRLMAAPPQATTPTSAVNLTPNATTSVTNSSNSQPQLFSHSRTSAGEELASVTGNAGPGAVCVDQRKKPQRMRTSFDADYELPYLMARFKENPNPTKESMEEIKQILNNMPSRKTKRKLDLTNIMYWFKNMRAGFRKRERLSGGTQQTDRQEGNGDASRGRLDRMEDDEDEDEEELEEEEEEKREQMREDGRLDLSEEEEGCSPRGASADSPPPCSPDGNDPNAGITEENKENVMKRQDGPQMTASPQDDEEQDDDTEIIEGRPEDFRDEEENDEGEHSALSANPPFCPDEAPMRSSLGDSSVPEDLSTTRQMNGIDGSSSLGPLPPLHLPLPTLLSHRPHPGHMAASWQQSVDEATAFAYLTHRVMASSSAGGQVASGTMLAAEAKLEPGLELKHNSVCDETDAGSIDSPLPGAAGSRKRKRTRVFIDPTTEVPKLKKWFLVDTHPTAQMIELYTSRLNSGEYRTRQQPLEPKNVQLWFKNHRAKVKRRRLNETGQESASNSGFLPPLSQSAPVDTPGSPASSDSKIAGDPAADCHDSMSEGQ